MTAQEAEADDDTSVQDDDRLLRRVHPEHVVLDQNRGVYRPSSAAFADATDGISVYLRSVLDRIDRCEQDVLEQYPRHSLVAFTASVARDKSLLNPPFAVRRDPDPADTPAHPCSPAHALLVGLLRGNPGAKRQRKPLAECDRLGWVVLRAPEQ